MMNFYNHSSYECIWCMIKFCCYSDLIMYVVYEGPNISVYEELKGCYKHEKGKKKNICFILMGLISNVNLG